jgi:gamma-glutamylcyclotransferase (GGCT)/AIG2-like uncharacterized protein YtfP
VHRLFVYGTLRHRPLIEGLVGATVPSRPAMLGGHRLAVLRDRPYPGLIAEPGSVAEGAIVTVDDHGLAVLDDFEGPEYTRTAVSVSLDDGSSVDAETYLLTGSSRRLVEPGVWRLDGFVAGAAEAWVRRATPGTHHPRH